MDPEDRVRKVLEEFLRSGLVQSTLDIAVQDSRCKRMLTELMTAAFKLGFTIGTDVAIGIATQLMDEVENDAAKLQPHSATKH